MIAIRLTAPLLLLLALGCTLPSNHLFNGRDLTGWDTYLVDPRIEADQVWTARDGVLICRGKPKGYLRTREAYANFRMTLEWRWPAGGKGGNSGVLLFSGGPSNLKPWPRCLESQLWSGKAGDFVLIGKGVDIQVPDKKKRQNSIIIANLVDDAERPIGQWNTMVITSVDGTVTVEVNGALANVGYNCTERRGPICLQSEGAEIHFRNITLQELP